MEVRVGVVGYTTSVSAVSVVGYFGNCIFWEKDTLAFLRFYHYHGFGKE